MLSTGVAAYHPELGYQPELNSRPGKCVSSRARFPDRSGRVRIRFGFGFQIWFGFGSTGFGCDSELVDSDSVSVGFDSDLVGTISIRFDSDSIRIPLGVSSIGIRFGVRFGIRLEFDWDSVWDSERHVEKSRFLEIRNFLNFIALRGLNMKF